jgi:hypothetical protein
MISWPGKKAEILWPATRNQDCNINSKGKSKSLLIEAILMHGAASMSMVSSEYFSSVNYKQLGLVWLQKSMVSFL